MVFKEECEIPSNLILHGFVALLCFSLQHLGIF